MKSDDEDIPIVSFIVQQGEDVGGTIYISNGLDQWFPLPPKNKNRLGSSNYSFYILFTPEANIPNIPWSTDLKLDDGTMIKATRQVTEDSDPNWIEQINHICPRVDFSLNDEWRVYTDLNTCLYHRNWNNKRYHITCYSIIIPFSSSGN